MGAAPVVTGRVNANGEPLDKAPLVVNVSVPTAAAPTCTPSLATKASQLLAAVLTKYIDMMCELPSES